MTATASGPDRTTHAVRVVLPVHLRRLAGVDRAAVVVRPAGPVTMAAVLDAIEAAHPALAGTIRDAATGRRRPLVRFFACEQDLSHDPLDRPLPDVVADGLEPLLIVGAMAGG
jgi:hypothetical protein